MPCKDIVAVYWTGWVLFTLLTFVCWLFGAQRGVPSRRINYHTVSFGVYFIVTWYAAGSYELLCVVDWPRDDGLVTLTLTRPMIAATALVMFSTLVTSRLGEMALDVVLHAIMAVASQAFWVLSALSYQGDDRFFWMWTSVSFAVGLVAHIWGESRARDCRDPRFGRLLLTNITAYVVVYYVITIWGELFEGFISQLAQEIALLINDFVAALVICLSAVHYGWSEGAVNRPWIRPDMITEAVHKGGPDAASALSIELHTHHQSVTTSAHASSHNST